MTGPITRKALVGLVLAFARGFICLFIHFPLSFFIYTGYAIVRRVLKPAYCSRLCVLLVLLQYCIAGSQTEAER
jgi:hypothetical protein